MDEVTNQSVVDSDPQMGTASPGTDSMQEQPTQELSETSQVASDQQDKSWIRRNRRDRDEAIRRAEEAERKAKIQEEVIKQLMTNANHPAQTGVTDEDILAQLEREEYATGDKMAKAMKQQKQDLERQIADLKKAQQQSYLERQEAEIRSQYADYDDVVNPDSLDILKETNPRLFTRVANLLKVDPMDGAVFAYETIKGAGIGDKMPDVRRSKEVEKKLDQNKKTIQSPTSFDKRPMAQAMNYPETKEARQALWNETLKYASMGGGGY
jgi:hypothetical protein